MHKKLIDHEFVRTSGLSWAAACLILAGLYFALARLGLLLASVHSSVSPVWPAAGLAVGTLMIGGFRLWPGITAGAFVANLLTPVSWTTAASIAAGSTLESIGGALAVLVLSHFCKRFKEAQYPLAFIGASMLAPIIGATLGVGALLAGHDIATEIISTLWLTWWIGDALGIFLVAPLITALHQTFRARPVPDKRLAVQAPILLIATAAICFLIFSGSGKAGFLFALFPILLSATIWFGSTGVKLTAVLIAVVSTSASYFGIGPFSGTSLNDNLIHLQIFLTSIATAALALPAFVKGTSPSLPIVTLFAGWTLSGWVFTSLNNASNRIDESHFRELVDNATLQIKQRTDTYQDVILAGVALFGASEEVTRQEWATVTKNLKLEERYPGAYGIGVISIVKPQDLSAYVAKVRGEGLPDFAIKRVPTGLVPQEGTEGHTGYVITMSEPLSANRQALGLDLATEVNRKIALELARDSGSPQLTRRVELVQEAHGRAGAIMCAPIYAHAAQIETIEQRQKACLGWVYIPIITEVLLHNVLGTNADELQLRFYEGKSTAINDLLYNSAGIGSSAQACERVTEIELLGQIYTLGWNRGPDFLTSDKSAPVWAGTSAAFISLLLAILVMSLQSTGRTAKALVVERTEALALTNELLQNEALERLRAETSLKGSHQLQRAILDSANYSIISTTCEGIIQTFNSGAERMLGFHANEVIGKTSPLIFHDKNEVEARAEMLRNELGRHVAAGFETFIAKAKILGLDENEWTYLRKDGSKLPVQLSVTTLRDEKMQVTGYLGIAYDLTTRKELESNLAKARDQALEASRLKSEFLATMSHEIRTPMNGVIGMSSMLLQTRLETKQREMAEVITFSAKNLLGIINDILDFSKIEAGKLRIDLVDFNLRDAIEETIALLTEQAYRKSLKLVCDVSPALATGVSGDRGRFQQVITNLLGNALKFTEHGEVRLTAQVIETTAERLQFSVEIEDTGVGIPETIRPHLFQPFVQADSSSTRRFGGTGLGLAISGQLVNLMGGHIDCESVEGAGSRFWFSLALPRVTLPHTEINHVPANTRMLVIDQNDRDRAILLRQLQSMNIAVDEATAPATALDILRNAASQGRKYAIALFDWETPHENGLALAREIRSDPLISSVSLIVLTSATPDISPETMARYSLSAVLAKPIREAQLRRSLLRIFGQHETASPFAPKRATSDRTLRLLMAEDNSTNQIVAQMMIEQIGHKVEIANNGQEALNLLSQAAYDAVLMDCQMPVLDGYETTRRIRSGQAAGINPRIPIIALTAFAMPGDQAKALAAGMDDYISKPFDLDALLGAFGRCGLLKQSPPPKQVQPQTAAPMPVSKPQTKSAFETARRDQLKRIKTPSGMSLWDKAVGVFIKEMPGRMTLLASHANARELDLLTTLAHTIVGSAANLGALELQTSARSLENASRAQDWNAIPSCLDTTQQAWEYVRAELSAGNSS